MSQQRKRAALQAAVDRLGDVGEGATPPPARGIAGTALSLHRDGLHAEIERLETALAASQGDGEKLREIDPAAVIDRLPADRDARGMEGVAFELLIDSIRTRGQDTPIVVRPTVGKQDAFELAAGRRRLEACRRLGRAVLARVRDLDDEAMLAVRFRENAEREDLSSFERGRWLAAVVDRQGLSSRKLGALFGLSQPTVVDYLKLGRLPKILTDALHDPRELTILDGRRLAKVLDGSPDVLGRMIASLEHLKTATTRRQVAHAARMAEIGVTTETPTQDKPARVIVDERGRKLGVLTRSGSQWVCRWAPNLDPEAIEYVTARLPALVAEWRRVRETVDPKKNRRLEALVEEE